ncbi:hypothetical protein [Tritonibacter mobilis]|uniref:hypothetical protein n=1 Tax=Tritonibacter mobilis TaxID=379347 RepID=UPI000806F15D|nr:hypothetical protein [Tritonibacter mobilis]GLP86496.1 hypothetical protein GCM10007921_20560 [Tritonibacter mobilis]SDX79080.1 hypothetical protein SAMN05444385_11376 [Tritonibacter mobilis]
MAVLETLFAFLGLGYSASQNSENRRLKAAALIANVEANTRSAALLADFEATRLLRKAEGLYNDPRNVIGPLLEMRAQCDQVLNLVVENRKLLKEKGANEQVLIELENWSANSGLMKSQVELAADQIDSLLSG